MIAPEGTIVNPLPPAPVAARGLTGFRIANTVFGALAGLAPERVPACESGGDTGISLGGYDAQRRPFVYLEFLHGSWGGGSGRDGIDASASVTVNFSNTPIELVEASYPLRVERYGFVPDSGGAGTWRGAASAWSRSCASSKRRRPSRCAPTGSASAPTAWPAARAGRRGPTCSPPRTGRSPRTARPGRTGPSPEDGGPWARLPAKTLLTVRRGDRFRHILPGAGGWGHPLERDPALVLDDVRQEKVTPAPRSRATASPSAAPRTATGRSTPRRRPAGGAPSG